MTVATDTDNFTFCIDLGKLVVDKLCRTTALGFYRRLR